MDGKTKVILGLALAFAGIGYAAPGVFVIDPSAAGLGKLLAGRGASAKVDPAKPEPLDPRAAATGKYDFRGNIASSGLDEADRKMLSGVYVACVASFKADQQRSTPAITDTAAVMQLLQNAVAYRLNGASLASKAPNIQPLAKQLNDIITPDPTTAEDVGLLSAQDAVAQRVVAALLDLSAQLVEPPKPAA